MVYVTFRRLVVSAALVSALAAGGVAGPSDDAEIVVRVDPRVELMCVIFRLAGNPEYSRAPDYVYVREVDAHFGPFREHAVVRMAKLLRNSNGVSYDAVMSMAVHLKEGTGVRARLPFSPQPERLDRRWSAESARQFVEQARVFATESKFEEFFAAHRDLYSRTEERMRARLAKRRYLAWFDEFFGARPGATFIVVPAMLNGGNCYAAGIRFSDQAEEIYQMMGVWSVDKAGVPLFGEDIATTVVHEFCHTYVNPVVDRHEDALEAAGTVIYPQVQAAMERQAYGNWMTMMRESCVRACVCRYVLKADGEEAAKAEIAAQHYRRFVWMGELVKVLGEYEGDRKRYPTFDSFFPRVVEFFNEYAQRGAAEPGRRVTYGPINHVLSEYIGESMVLVKPDAIADADVAGQMDAFLEVIHGRFYAAKGVKLVRAQEANDDIRTAKAMVLYGSPSSNAVLADVLRKCEAEVTPKRIKIGGRVFAGENQVLIACFPNPYNTGLPVVVYASATDEDVVELNDFFHGPTDYLVGRWSEGRMPVVLHQGDFSRDASGAWVVAD